MSQNSTTGKTHKVNNFNFLAIKNKHHNSGLHAESQPTGQLAKDVYFIKII